MSEADGLPASVLFACTYNAIRSPMAAELMRMQFGSAVRVDSVGLRPVEEVSYMAAFVMDEAGGDISSWQPKGFDFFETDYFEDGPFDLIVSLSPEAHHTALEQAPILPPPPSTGRPSTPLWRKARVIKCLWSIERSGTGWPGASPHVSRTHRRARRSRL